MTKTQRIWFTVMNFFLFSQHYKPFFKIKLWLAPTLSQEKKKKKEKYVAGVKQSSLHSYSSVSEHTGERAGVQTEHHAD